MKSLYMVVTSDIYELPVAPPQDSIESAKTVFNRFKGKGVKIVRVSFSKSTDRTGKR